MGYEIDIYRDIEPGDLLELKVIAPTSLRLVKRKELSGDYHILEHGKHLGMVVNKELRAYPNENRNIDDPAYDYYDVLHILLDDIIVGLESHLEMDERRRGRITLTVVQKGKRRGS